MMTKLIVDRWFLVAIIFMSIATVTSALGGTTGEENAVYSTVLRKVYEDDRITYSNCCEFVILENTKVDEEAWWEGSSESAKYRDLFNDLKRRNAVSEPIAKSLPIPAYHLVGQGELDKLFAEGELMYEAAKANLKPHQLMTGSQYWLPFHRKYPKSRGLHTLSKVGFERKRSLALVNVTFQSNFTGFSRMYILRKKGRTWNISSWWGMESMS